MNSKKLAVTAVALASLISVASYGATYSPVANLTEKWDSGVAAWTNTAGGLANSQGALVVSFAAVGDTWSGGTRSCLIRATAASSSGRYIGSYADSGVNAIAFDIKRDGMANTGTLAFIGGGKKWSYTVQLPPADSQWHHVEVPFGPSCGWVPTDASASFQASAGSIDRISFSVDCVGDAAQSIQMDNFKVLGPWGGPTINGTPESWLLENGLGLDAAATQEDTDKDGLSNYGEYLAGSDPHSASSYFRVSVLTDAAGNPFLTWNKGNGKKFGILQSSDLTSFSKIATGVATNEVPLADSGSGPYFYQVEIEE